MFSSFSFVADKICASVKISTSHDTHTHTQKKTRIAKVEYVTSVATLANRRGMRKKLTIR